MWARRLIYTLLATLPVIFTASIAVGTRLTVMEWSTPEFGEKTNAALRAYAPVVRLTQTDSPPAMHPQEASVVRVAHEWVDKDYPPLSAGKLPASGLDGPLYDVQRARQLTCMNLARIASALDQEGNKKHAAELLGLAVRVAEVAKYSSLNSTSTATEFQREAMNVLSRLSKDLDKETRSRLAIAVDQITVRPETIKLLAENLMESTREEMATAKSLKRFVSASMTPTALQSGPVNDGLAELTTDELTFMSLSEATSSTTLEMPKTKDSVLKTLRG